MATIIGTGHDQDLLKLCAALGEYERQNPGSAATLFRENPGTLRIRLIDDRTAGMPKSRRHSVVWSFLQARAGEELMSQVAQLLVLPTSELRSSLSNLEFDDLLVSK